MKQKFHWLVIVFLFFFAQAWGQPHYHYLTYLPQQYDSTKHKRWPLVIYLHGKSACGNDLSKVSRYGLPFFMERGMHIDAVALAPQCPEGNNWTTEDWFTPFLKEVCKKYRIDTTRIYLTGMSLGGFGTWDLAIKYPRRFAAIAPLCGGGRPQQVCAIKDVPIWVLHGDLDEQVPIQRSEEMVEALRKCGGNPKFTVLKGFPHDIHRTYSDENLYKWMLQYSLNTRSTYGNLAKLKNDTVRKITTKPEKQIPVEKSETIAKGDKKKKTKKSPATSTTKTADSKRKQAREAQADTLKGKDFILVF